MGLVIHKDDLPILKKTADRERAPFYNVGEVTGDMRLTFANKQSGTNPIDLALSHFFGSSPTTVLTDETATEQFETINTESLDIQHCLQEVLQLEAVACKDWLTNKVDRSVTGKVATQQTCGEIQLPLNNLGVMALDYRGTKGVATAIGHAPVAALVDPGSGSRLAVAEALTNLIWTPLTHGLQGVSLSANWMWPAKYEGENARLYSAVEALSDFVCQLGINIPTGKDSLSMVQKYPDGSKVFSPGTVIISAVAEVADINRTVSPALVNTENSSLVYIDFAPGPYHLGGSSLAQILNKLGNTVPDATDADYLARAFGTVQDLITKQLVLAGHDISAGGMVTTLLEMCFPTPQAGLDLDISSLGPDLFSALFSEKPGVIIQTTAPEEVCAMLDNASLVYCALGQVTNNRVLKISHHEVGHTFEINPLRDTWFRTSYLLDQKQSGEKWAGLRYENYKKQPLQFNFPTGFTGKLSQYGIDSARRQHTGLKAAIIREKGVNGDREMAYAMHLAGFDVKDVHMTDLMTGREDLSDVRLIVFVGGFSNSDVLGSAKGWAGAFMYNETARQSLDRFYARKDTLSLGVCNGCQLMMELDLINPELGRQTTCHATQWFR